MFWGVSDCSEELEPTALYAEVQDLESVAQVRALQDVVVLTADLTLFEPISLVNSFASGGCA